MPALSTSRPVLSSLAAIACLAAACAHAHPVATSTASGTGPSVVASSLAPMPDEATVGPARGEDDSQLGAAVLLERALTALRAEEPGFATAALRAALATGELNDAGRSLAYWYIYTAEEMQGHRRGSKDALLDFVVVADGVMAIRTKASASQQQSGTDEFVDRFDLAGRLARGRALLNLAWARDHRQFGRSAIEPVPVHSAAEVDYFVELAPECAEPFKQRVAERRVVRSGPLALQQVDLKCADHAGTTAYFFEWHGGEQP